MRRLVRVVAFGLFAATVPVVVAQALEVQNDLPVGCELSAPNFTATVEGKATKSVDYSHKFGTSLVAVCKGGQFRNVGDRATCIPDHQNLAVKKVHIFLWQFGSFTCGTS